MPDQTARTHFGRSGRSGRKTLENSMWDETGSASARLKNVVDIEFEIVPALYRWQAAQSLSTTSLDFSFTGSLALDWC